MRSFAVVYNPTLQVVCAKNIKRAFTGDAPTIATLIKAFEEEHVEAWIKTHIAELNVFAGSSVIMSDYQMNSLRDIIIVEYYYLKASELLLFFHQFKTGKYGELYGSVDPLRITSALLDFTSYRRDMLTQLEREADKERREVEAQERERTAITRKEYLVLKRRKQRVLVAKRRKLGKFKTIKSK